MNNMKKIASLLLVVIMMLAMAVPAMATDITITGGATGSTYSAWKLLNATNAVDSDNKGTDKFAYTLNDKYTAILQAVTGETEQADIVAYIAALNGDEVRVFAEAVYKEIVDAKLAADETTATDKFADVDQGYWLIAETAIGNNGNDKPTDTYSLIMLDTAGADNIEVSTKESVPTVEKKVKDTNDTTGVTSGWQDSADHDLNDKVPFQLTATLANNVSKYETYKVVFHDTLSAGLTYNEDAKVMFEGKDVTSFFTIVEENGKLTISCNNVKAEGFGATDSSVITVEYTATLNDKAVMGSAGNPNVVYLEYSNNPNYNDGGDNETGKTPEDKVIVFTYKVVVNKTDKAGAALKGAGFTLYKGTPKADAAEGATEEEKYTWTQIGSELPGDDMTTFTWERLDDGVYKLVETTTPAGYNTIKDIIFTIVAEHEENSVDPQLTKLEGGTMFTGEVSTGTLSANVINESGTELPSTGGIGTTIFYIAGAILVVGAVVVIISKKRSSEK